MAPFAAAEDPPKYTHQLAVELDAAFRSLSALEKSVVAAVHGAVAGAGLALMLSCDVVIATASTKFVFAYPGIGFTPDCDCPTCCRVRSGSSARLCSLVGMPATASEALARGMLGEVVEEPRRGQLSSFGPSRPAPRRRSGRCGGLLRQGWEMDRVETGLEEAGTITEMVIGRRGAGFDQGVRQPLNMAAVSSS